MIDTPSFIKIGSGIQKFLSGIYSYMQTQRREGDLINLFFKIR
jgi:hypothetical protein